MRTMLRLVSLALVLAGVLASLAAGAQERTFTTNADFDEGVLSSVHHNVPDQLQLTEFSETKPFIYIANHRYGSVSKIDTNTGKEVARYAVCLNNVGNNNLCPSTSTWTRPHAWCDWSTKGHCPSRTAVDLNGDVWVANRAFGNFASVTKIAGEPGHCIDRNNNGIIETSMDVNNDGKINVTESETMAPNAEFLGQNDECILFTKVVGTVKNEVARALAIDANNNAWVGTYETKKAYKFSNDGNLLGTYTTGSNNYGFAVDGLGYLYNSDLAYGIIRQIRTSDGVVVKSVDTPFGTYGVAAEKDTQVVWLGRWGGSYGLLVKVDFKPATPTYTYYNHPNWSYWGQTRGVAVDADGNVWVASWTHNQVAKFNPKTGAWGGTYSTAAGPIGVGIDSVKRIWTSNQNSNCATRVDPVTGQVMNSVTIGSEPYSYSDMTGFQLTQGVVTQGTWTVTYDSGVAGLEWGTVSWNQFGGICPPEGCIPANTEIKVEVRASDTFPVPQATAWQNPTNGTPFVGLFGRYVEIRATLRIIGAGKVSPVLTDLTVKPKNQPPVCNTAGQLSVVCNGSTSTVAVNGSGSSDPEGLGLTYSWSAGTCGALNPTFDDPAAASTNVTFGSAGTCQTACQFKLTVSDGNSSASCFQSLAITDQAPTLTGVANASAECNNGLGGVAADDPQLAAFFAGPSAFDACTASATPVTNDAPAAFGLGDTAVTFMTTDTCANTASAAGTVTVADTQGPGSTFCPGDETLSLDGACKATASYTANATDACTGAASDTYEYSFAAPGVQTYTYTFADANGNNGSCPAAQTVTAVDDTAPSAVGCPADDSVVLDGASCMAEASYTATATDNCSGELTSSYTYSFESAGTLTHLYTFADGSDNAAQCSAAQAVTALDKTAPFPVDCPADATLFLGETCEATASFSGLAQDACSGDATDAYTYTFAGPGTQSYTYTFVDESGNSSQCAAAQTVTAVDAMAPATQFCPGDDTLVLDPLLCIASSSYTGTALDNCSGALTDSNEYAFSAPGSASGLYSFTDAAGNAVECPVQTVTAVDQTAPVVDCPANDTLVLDALTCTAAKTYAATAVDACDGAQGLTHTYSFNAPGSQAYSYLFSDASGNEAGCTQTVNAIDVTPPAALCNNPPTMMPRDAPKTFTATGTDNCSVGGVVIKSYDCTAVNGAGKVISKLGSCVVTINGASLTVVDSGGVGDHITWSGLVVDGSGNVTPFACAIDVVKPGNSGTGCNQGVGNGPEGCDPGNSNQGNPANSNDEKGGTPGNPGKSNNKKK